MDIQVIVEVKVAWRA